MGIAPAILEVTSNSHKENIHCWKRRQNKTRMYHQRYGTQTENLRWKCSPNSILSAGKEWNLYDNHGVTI